MLGTSFKQSSEVESFMEFITKEIEIPATLLVWNSKGLISADQAAIDRAVADIQNGLAVFFEVGFVVMVN